MAKRDDIHKVLIIGSGPIVIGQACEFDYSGTQACKALRACGYKIVLVNSNPATIMTDPVMADATYIEPLNVERLEQIIAKEKPDALLPNLGGQTGLNLSIALSKAGILAKYNVRVIGVNLDAIERGEDREVFKETMRSLGIGLPDSRIIHTVEQAEQAASELNYPVVVRPAYTMGGAGGGLVYNIDELRAIVTRGLDLSLTRQCLIEQSILGWEELEVEVVRDATGKMVTVCFIENVDAVGVHTGDSFCTAPMLTIPVEVQQECQRIAFKVVESIGVIGGTNVQLARDPKTGRIVIIEINPRTSRSSALASKATGFPIALVSAQLAAGLNLADLPYWRDGTLDQYTPSGDYVVVKFARWAFEKFKGVQDKLGTQMKAVGEVMSIGKTYKEAFQKAIRSLENGRSGLGFAKNFNDLSKDELLANLRTPTSERHYVMYEALRKGATVDEVNAITHVKAWFIEQMLELVQLEEKILAYKDKAAELPGALLKQAKLDGFADKYLAKLLGVSEKQIRERRVALGLVESWEAVPVSGVENAAYYFSTYGAPDAARPCVSTANPKKVMILGGGPNRIGQGIEFDYCCVHAAFALRDAGYETIMVNCNPETVSTDYDTSDKLYFEPLTVEDVLQIYNKEKPFGVVVQFGGQTPLNIARELAANGVNILGTSIDSIDDAEDRDLFRHKMERLEIPMPESGMASTFDEAKAIADKIGYPIMIRPSFILGGRGMEVIYDEDMLREYVAKAIDVSPERPLLLDRFLQSALECEADALADGKDVFIPAVMQHIELAGVHSGDSACVIPPVSIDPKHLETINTYTRKIAQELKVVGLMNMQYAIENDKVYVLEANPRASRTVPLVSKVCNVQMARIATQLMLGATIPSMNLAHKTIPHYGVKESVLPFDKFPEVDPILGPEMRSTGEVLGLSADFGLAFCKAQEAAQNPLPSAGTVLMSVWERTPQVIDIARTLIASGFKLRATVGTRAFLAEHDIAADLAIKIGEGRPDIPDDIKNGLVQFIVNSPISKRASKKDDSYIRKAAIKHRVPYMTTLAAAHAAAKGIAVKIKNPTRPIYSLQEYHANIK
ncbi:carbamoyl-phosphate synthase large subunit [Ereboglobus luteus]|uniref:Carbamoyl phosphate synthase large subunit n=1 Tax=Ereboglobus luteus TaxID=1796921 RepID=A0A2U8E0J9_9BACT|nr:carbamoyl-phosphate synthase large subunit [Ereboglobus luteus]AWI08224.1 carbamoyl phosphate synthase large subunit [Ereboglobus luteus]